MKSKENRNKENNNTKEKIFSFDISKHIFVEYI